MIASVGGRCAGRAHGGRWFGTWSRCSRLSSTTSIRSAATRASGCAAGSSPVSTTRPTASAMAYTISFASATSASDMNHTPSGWSAATCSATATASRVLPMPPGPTIVSSRQSASRRSSATARTSLAADEGRRLGGQVDLLRTLRIAAGLSTCRHVVVLVQCGDEPISLPVYRPNHPLISSVVTDRLPDRFDPARQRRFGHEPVLPDAVEELLFRNDPLTLLDQMNQHGEHLRLHFDQVTRPSDLMGSDVDRHVREPNHHPHQCRARHSPSIDFAHAHRKGRFGGERREFKNLLSV